MDTVLGPSIVRPPSHDADAMISHDNNSAGISVPAQPHGVIAMEESDNCNGVITRNINCAATSQQPDNIDGQFVLPITPSGVGFHHHQTSGYVSAAVPTCQVVSQQQSSVPIVNHPLGMSVPISVPGIAMPLTMPTVPSVPVSVPRCCPTVHCLQAPQQHVFYRPTDGYCVTTQSAILQQQSQPHNCNSLQ